MDAKVMDFPEGSFDAILDKATLDSILVFIFFINSVDKIRLQMLQK